VSDDDIDLHKTNEMSRLRSYGGQATIRRPLLSGVASQAGVSGR
jgi:hypothetical protein